LGATGAAASFLQTQSEAAVVGSTTVMPFGINDSIPIDFNADGEIDFEIDHDRDADGEDYLQIDKNDHSGFGEGVAFPDGPTLDGQNDEHTYLTDFEGNYPLALMEGYAIGPDSPDVYDYDESINYNGSTGTTRRANRLIDEDLGQAETDWFPPDDTPKFLGLNGETRYLGLRVDFNGDGDGNELNYAWIGVRITNEADATGEVTGYAYETDPGIAILAGDAGSQPEMPGDLNGDNLVNFGDLTPFVQALTDIPAYESMYPGLDRVARCDVSNDGTCNFGDLTPFVNLLSGAGSASAVPEPGSLLLAACCGLALIGSYLLRRLCRKA
jgi:hypothetical protein